MNVPIYVITGYLGAGKTTYLNKILSHKKNYEKNTLVIQFEDGEEEVEENLINTTVLIISKREYEIYSTNISNKIYNVISDGNYDEIWVEWNGMDNFKLAEEIFLQIRMKAIAHLERVIYIADADSFPIMIQNTGINPITMLYASDIAYIYSANKENKAKTKKILLSYNRKLDLVYENDFQEHLKQLDLKKMTGGSRFIWFIMLICVYLLLRNNISSIKWLYNDLIIYTGMLLEGMPFLVIGVLLSTFIQLYVSGDWIARVYPKNPVIGMITAIGMGFCLPICDCASVPVFQSLLKKNVPLCSAVTFLLVTPIVNPVVLLSTYYAFNGNIKVLGYRIALGIVCSIIVGGTFYIFKSKSVLKYSGNIQSCSCYCCMDDARSSEKESGLIKFMRHARYEFVKVAKYLLIGAFISTMFQAVQSGILKNVVQSHSFTVIILLMIMAFFLSLCSTSDAVIARSLASTFPFASTMGFMVFGPMMDIKNILLLSSGFEKKFIIRLALTVFVVCLLVIMLFSFMGSGGISYNG